MPRISYHPVLLATLCAAAAAVESNPRPPKAGLAEGANAARAATAGEISLLNEVLHKTADDYRRWAYTERRVMRDDKGKVKSETVLRYDPSKPYTEQWTPLKIDGEGTHGPRSHKIPATWGEECL